MCLNGEICASSLCRHRMAGTGGVGRAKAHPAVRGDTPREAAYRRSHPDCEAVPGCTNKPLLHHVDRRLNRATSRLLMACTEHHAMIHSGQLDDGRKQLAVPSG